MAEQINNAKKDDSEKIIDTTLRVKLITTKEAPYHTEGEEIEVAPAVAEIMLKNKWAKKVSE